MEGIDVYSKYQTVQNWNFVRAADVGWCYQKVSDGTTTRTVQSPAAGRAAGVLQGGYHFSQPGNPVTQANLLVDRCISLGMLDLNPALDLEDNPPGVGSNIPDSQKADWAIAFGRQVLARGHGFTVYANDSTWGLVKTKLMRSVPQTFRWVARYRTAPPDNPYDAWQYTSSGHVPGISGSVDRSRGKVPTNKKEDVDVPLTTADLDAIAERVRNEVRFGVLATGHDPNNPNANTPTIWTFNGRNIADILLQILANQEGLTAALIQALTPALVQALDEATADLEVQVDAQSIADTVANTLRNRLVD